MLNVIDDFGASGNGVNDDTVAIQAALDSQSLVNMPEGIYKISQPLRFKSNSKLRGSGGCIYPPGTSRSDKTLGDIGKSTVIKWDENVAPSEMIAMLQVSYAAPGIDPISDGNQSFDTTLYSVEISNITIDGSGKANIGLYAMRCQNGSTFDSITVTKCVNWGILGLALYSGIWRRISAVRNQNHGMQFGGNPWSKQWASGYNYGSINAVHFDSLYAATNGTNGYELIQKSSDSTLGSPRMIGEGISLYLHRGNVVTNPTAENNYGPGIYCAGTAGPNRISGGYLELNCYYKGDGTGSKSMLEANYLYQNKPIGLFIETNPYWLSDSVANPPQHLEIASLWLADATDDKQWIKFSGEPNAGRPESWTVLRQVGIGSGIIGGIFNNSKRYTTENCFKELTEEE